MPFYVLRPTVKEFDAHLADTLPDGVHGMATTADLTLYVDNSLGNDANTGLAAGVDSALKTIQAAIDKVPQVVNHTVTVNVAAGTYAETVTIQGFVGKGAIRIYGGASVSAAANYLIDGYIAEKNTVFLSLDGFKANSDSSSGEFAAKRCTHAEFNYCVTERGTTHGFYLIAGNYAINYCKAANHTYGLTAYYSNVSCYDCYGLNVYGVNARSGATISCFGNAALGKVFRGSTANRYTYQGGVIGPLETWNNVTLYVHPDGSDDNDGSANDAAHALLTINEAIRRLPPRIDHIVTIEVATGAYNEVVNISGFIGKGRINLYGAAALADTHTTIAVQFDRNTCFVYVRGIKALDVASQSFYGVNNLYVNLEYCKTVGSGGIGLNLQSGIYSVGSCEASNKSNGIYATMCGFVYSNNNTGTGNTTGIKANAGGEISKAGTQPGGTTAESTSSGGQIR